MKLKIGIDKIGFHTPHFYVDMEELAEARGVEPAKFTIGIGQEEMAVAPLSQDPVTLAANAALQIVDEEDRDKIDLVLFGTESGIDHSKSAGIYVHRLLNLNNQARTVELKQACYGGTAALQFAKGHIALHPERTVLVLASDIARYGQKTSGKIPQVAVDIAMVISQNPKIMELENDSTYLTKDIMDFWRPTYSDVAYVDGKYSNEQYISFFKDTWEAYKQETKSTLDDFAALCFNLRNTKMGKKALREILGEATETNQKQLTERLEDSLYYSKRVGNIYTASLYLGLLSLLENTTLQAGDKIGLFSYGSGAVGEFFTGTLQPGYEQFLQTELHRKLFQSRKQVSVPEYEEIFEDQLPQDGSTIDLDVSTDPNTIRLTGITGHSRQYSSQNE